MTVRQTAMVGLNEGKRAARAVAGVVAGVVAPPRRIPSPASCGGGSIRPLGGLTGLADVGGARLALGGPAALAVQGEALQQLAQQGLQAGGQQDAPGQKKGPPARLREGAVSAAPTGCAAAARTATTWGPRRSDRGQACGLPGQGGAETEERPAPGRVWPAAPGVPAPTREAARVGHWAGAALVMPRDRVVQDKGAPRQFRRQLLQLLRCQIAGRDDDGVGPSAQVDACHDHAVDQVLRLDAQLRGARLQAAGALEAGLPAAVVAEFRKPPRQSQAVDPQPESIHAR